MIQNGDSKINEINRNKENITHEILKNRKIKMKKDVRKVSPLINIVSFLFDPDSDFLEFLIVLSHTSKYNLWIKKVDHLSKMHMHWNGGKSQEWRVIW